MELIFPPAFFDVMVHLAVHLPQEAKIGGPVQYQWMYPIERFLGTQKGFVRNRAHPEGSIAESYIVSECLTLCSMYLDGIETQFNAPERNYDIEVDDELPIFSSKARPLGAAHYVQMTSDEIDKMHLYVLSNCEEVQPYMEDHLNSIDVADQSRKHAIHKSQFPKWFNERMTRESTVNQSAQILALHSLSCAPTLCITIYTGCIINGVRFHTNDRETRRKSQNSGVMVQGNHNEDIINFYVVLVDIIQLDYVRDKVVLLFKCDWYDVDKRRSRILQDGALTSVRVDRLWYLSDPFVLATQANQVFYINDPKLGLNWRVVHHFNHRHIFTGECEIDNNEDDMEWNDDAYQDEKLLNKVGGVRELGNVMEQSLRREDVSPEIVSPTTRTVDNVGEKQKEQLSHPECDEEALASTNPAMPTPSPRTPIMATPSPTMPCPTTLNLETQNVETTRIPLVDNQEESPNDTRGSVAGENDEELMDQNEDIQFSKKQVRGLTRGVGLYKRNRRAAKKLDVEIDPVFGRCLQIDHGTKVANELGQIAPAYLWPIRKDKEVREAIFGDVLLKLQGKLTIKNIRNTAVQEKLWQHFLLIVRGKRGRFRAIYRLHGDATKSHRPSNVSEATWNSLCDYWADEDVQVCF
ncbi:hypothetical protein LINGRAHAP2_LOCUS30783 [Linum grandiflorum]